MAYGSSAYGAAAYGGGANANNEQVFFSYTVRDPNIVYEARVDFSGPEEFYEMLTRQGIEETPVLYKIYTSHGEGETPQLQTTVGGGGPTQSIIPATAIIVVTAEIQALEPNNFAVVGRPYTQ